MAKDRLPGKLVVILHADIAGSTLLVQQDEQLAHERIQDAFQRFTDTIQIYQGHVLELRGDALLAEFERASDAVAATLAFQTDHTYFISRLKDEIRPTLRVGIAMGEVVIADSTVTGAGVVLAQRVEQLADPGGVCITAALHESLPKRLPFDLENLGEQVLKGFDDPVRVYRVELSDGQSVPAPQQGGQNKPSATNPKLILAVIVLALVIAGGSAYWFKIQVPQEEPASLGRMAFPLPDKPSIAVLPFTNMSDMAEQEYFVDGMTENLITDISKVSGLFVIARNSVFTYKGKAVKVRQVAEELGVRYVMEGSVQRVGNKVRINAQLIDATTGGHVWAERYDGLLDDVFSMQDRITQSIVTALAITLNAQEKDGLAQVETSNPEAYDAFLLGWEHYRRTTPNDYSKAVAYFEQAIELDPDYARAHSALAAVYWNSAWRYWVENFELTAIQLNEKARIFLQSAMQSPSALTHQIASERSVFFDRRPGKALAEAEVAIALDANDPAGHLAKANALLKAKKPREAITSMRQAMRLDPHYPASYLTRLGRAQFDLGQYQQAAATLAQTTGLNSQDDRAFVYLSAALGHLGRKDEAISIVKKVNKLRAGRRWGKLVLNDLRFWKWIGDRQRLREGLHIAGVESGVDWYSRVSRTGDNIDIEGATKINAREAKQLHESGVQFVDIDRNYAGGRIPGAHNLIGFRGRLSLGPRQFNEIRLLEIVNKSQGLVVYGSDFEDDAAFASAMAVEMGFEKVYYFSNGFDQWKAAGYPVETGKK